MTALDPTKRNSGEPAVLSAVIPLKKMRLKMQIKKFTTEDCVKLTALFNSGDIINASKDQLEEYAIKLSLSNVSDHFSPSQFLQMCETIRTLMVRSHIGTLQNQVVELHSHITSLNRKNSVTQYCVIALTIAALIGTGAQVWYAKKADQRSLSEQQQTIAVSEMKKTEPQHDNGLNPAQLKLVPKTYQNTTKNDSAR